MRAWGSPKIPATVALGRNPGKRYASHSRRGRCGVGMRRSCPILALPPQCFRPRPERVFAPSAPCFHPLTSTKSPEMSQDLVLSDLARISVRIDARVGVLLFDKHVETMDMRWRSQRASPQVIDERRVGATGDHGKTPSSNLGKLDY